MTQSEETAKTIAEIVGLCEAAVAAKDGNILFGTKLHAMMNYRAAVRDPAVVLALVRDSQECICRGNWRTILAECRNLIGDKFARDGREYTFFGLVDSKDDYYYGMIGNDNDLLLLSCVGSLETHGFAALAAEPKP
jgi:hypothetical protein